MTAILNTRVPWIVFATIQAMLCLLAVATSEWHESIAWLAGTIATAKVCTLLPR